MVVDYFVWPKLKQTPSLNFNFLENLVLDLFCSSLLAISLSVALYREDRAVRGGGGGGEGQLLNLLILCHYKLYNNYFV